VLIENPNWQYPKHLTKAEREGEEGIGILEIEDRQIETVEWTSCPGTWELTCFFSGKGRGRFFSLPKLLVTICRGGPLHGQVFLLFSRGPSCHLHVEQYHACQ